MLNRSSRYFRGFLGACAGVALFSGLLFAEPSNDFSAKLNSVEDLALQKTLSNSIAVGLIKTEADFDQAYQAGISRMINDNPVAMAGSGNFSDKFRAAASEIEQLAAPLASLDKDGLKNVIMHNNRPEKLFSPLSGQLPGSYKATVDLCAKFNPKVGTDETSKLAADIDQYLKSIENDPTIQHALKSTNSTMADLKKNWFGPGAGFEHVIAGEYNGGEVSGYHWWYMFYHDEANNSAFYGKTLEGAGDPTIFTGQFSWDPDGNGPLPKKNKKKGGFSVGNSAQSLLALGHIALETFKKNGSVPGAVKFKANLNGKAFTWQLFTMGGTIRSLYPMVTKESTNTEIRRYYELEQEALPGSSSPAPTFH
jgi:hypothetical protein